VDEAQSQLRNAKEFVDWVRGRRDLDHRDLDLAEGGVEQLGRRIADLRAGRLAPQLPGEGRN
jgi:hypothetical protein